MKEISRQTYEVRGGIHSASPLGLTTEKRWFSHDTMLGIVLLDNVDHDWSFVALANDPRSTYRCFDVACSFKTPALAEEALARAFERGPDDDFYTEDV